jgi:hypothetical protein
MFCAITVGDLEMLPYVAHHQPAVRVAPPPAADPMTNVTDLPL